MFIRLYSYVLLPGFIISPFGELTTTNLSSKCFITSSKPVKASNKLISAE